MSKASTLARKPAATRKYMQTFRRLQKRYRAFTCEHGHFGCAAEPRGACTEELLHAIGADDDADDGWPYFSKFRQRFTVRRRGLAR
jgi:hypothetical protein